MSIGQLPILWPLRICAGDHWIEVPRMDITPRADIADAFMQERSADARVYCVVILEAELKQDRPGAGNITCEEGRRNIQRQARALLLAACHVVGGSDVTDQPILDSGAGETEGFAANDADGRTGILFYEVHPFRKFTEDGFV